VAFCWRAEEMNRLLALVVGVVALALLPTVASAQASRFAGDWVNVDPNTRGIVSLHITVSPEKVTVEGKGLCHPVNCTIPPHEVTAFSPAGTPDGEADVLAYDHRGTPSSIGKSYSTIQLLSFTKMSDGLLLRVESFNRYDDGSGRGPWHFTYYFRRAGEAGK
jgi:hypothetical protein